MKMIKDFCRNQHGNIAMITGLLMVPMTMMVGLAVEYSSLERERVALQSITDASALAAIQTGADDTVAIRKARAENMFKTSAEQENLVGATAQFNLDGTAITAKANYRHNMLFKMLADNVEISVSSDVSSPKPAGRVLDVVMCIDATTSMGGTIDAVRRNASNFADDLQAELKARDQGEFDLMRTKVIYFRDIVYWRDFFSNGSVWAESSFFTFPTENADFQRFVNENTQGGMYNADFPESGNECLYKGMTSKWLKVGDPIPATSSKPAGTAHEVLPIVIMWTDADPKPVSDPASRASPANPDGMPNNQSDFVSLWNNPVTIDQKNKMFILFGPCGSSGWRLGMGLPGATCGGSVYDGNSNMIRKIADAIAKVNNNRTPFLSG